jgi:hypothetical protein
MLIGCRPGGTRTSSTFAAAAAALAAEPNPYKIYIGIFNAGAYWLPWYGSIAIDCWRW